VALTIPLPRLSLAALAGVLERILGAGQQYGVTAAPAGPIAPGGMLAGAWPGPAVLSQGAIATVSAGSGTVLTAAQLTGNAGLAGAAILRAGPGAAFTDTTDTAAALVAAFPAPAQLAGQAFRVLIINTTGVTMTLAPGAGVGFAGNLAGGNFTIAAGAQRTLFAQITNASPGSQAVTIAG
jgi:hypothetical protein